MELGDWVAAFAAIAKRAVAEGDIVGHLDPEGISRLLVSMYLGLRQTSDLAESERFLGDLEQLWTLILPGIATPDRVDYLTQFVRRRTKVAVKKAIPLKSE